MYEPTKTCLEGAGDTVPPPQPQFPDAVFEMLDAGLVDPFEPHGLHQSHEALETRAHIRVQRIKLGLHARIKKTSDHVAGCAGFIGLVHKTSPPQALADPRRAHGGGAAAARHIGAFWPELRRFVLAPYHQGQVTVPRRVAQLRGFGLAISKRQVVRPLIARQERFLDEARDVLCTGFKAAAEPWRTPGMSEPMSEPSSSFHRLDIRPGMALPPASSDR